MNINEINTVEEVEAYRKSINESCDKRITTINKLKKANELSNKPFAYIKESVEAIAPSLFESAEGKGILKKYVSLVKGTPNLKTMHMLYESVRKCNKDSDIDFFASEISSTNWNIDKKTIKEDCKKLGMILAEGYMLVNNADDLLPEENAKLSNAISYIAENKKSKNNIAEYSSAIKIIKESVMNNNEIVDFFANRDIDKMSESLIENFNKKYDSQLTIEEANALKEICESENREDVFNKYKNQVIDKINEAKKNFADNNDTDSIQRMETILEKVNNKKYSLDTLGNDVCTMIEISKSF